MKSAKTTVCYIIFIFFWCLLAHPAFAAKKDTLIWAISSKIPTMDIYATTSLNLTNIYSMVSDSLVERDLNDLSIKPGLAKSWKRIDETTWEFELQPNIKYHNGNLLTSEAIRYTIMDRILNPDMKAKLRSAYKFIKEVEVIDDLHFKIHTTGPYPLVLERFCTFFHMILDSVKKMVKIRLPSSPWEQAPIKWLNGKRDQSSFCPPMKIIGLKGFQRLNRSLSAPFQNNPPELRS